MKNTTQDKAFIVDINNTLSDSNRISADGKDKQKLYCTCGASKKFSQKIKRTIIKNCDTGYDDRESLQSISCDKCKEIYDSNNRAFLINPDTKKMYKVVFEKEQKGNVVSLKRNKTFPYYNSKEDSLTFIERVDVLSIDLKTKEISLKIEKKEDDEMNNSSPSSNSQDFLSKINISNISDLEHFFQFNEFIEYYNLDVAFSFFKDIDSEIVDLDSIKKIPSIGNLYKNYEIFSETNDKGKVSYYQMIDSGFGDGKKSKKQHNPGSYLSRLKELSKVFMAVLNYPNITTILLTKGPVFFKEFLSSEYICSSEVYTKHNATSPTKIIEISTNYTKSGVLRKDSNDNNDNAEAVLKKSSKKVAKLEEVDINSEVENKNYLRISPIIYKYISSADDLGVLLNVYNKGYVTKTDIESLFQNYPADRLYRLYGSLNKQRISVQLSIKHLKHMMDRELDASNGGFNSDFVHLYNDTINTINLLELSPNYIFKIKDAKELKEQHDDLAARYGAVKDAKKAEFYKKSADEFKKLNSVIDDVEFTVIPNLESLNKEGMIMGHCIYTYLEKVCNQTYLAVHVQHVLSNERATLGLYRSGKGLEFDQLKGYRNSRATREMIEATMQFLKDNKISSKGGSSSDLSPNKGGEVKMSDYLSDEEVQKIRDERAEKEEKEMKQAKKEGKEYTAPARKSKSKKGLFSIFNNED